MFLGQFAPAVEKATVKEAGCRVVGPAMGNASLPKPRTGPCGFGGRTLAKGLKDQNKIIWKYEPKQDFNVIAVMCCDTVNRGLSYADGKIFLSQADTTLVALDAKTGKVVWSVKNGDPGKGETSTGAPMVMQDKVLVGISGGEFGVRGSVTAYNMKTGQRAMRGQPIRGLRRLNSTIASMSSFDGPFGPGRR